MNLRPPLLLLACFLLIGCTKEPASAPVQAPAPPKAQKITEGKVELVGLPDSMEPIVEVLTVEFVPNRVYEMVTQQQRALDAYLNPKTESTTPVSTVVSPEDQEKITATITKLQSDFPERVTTEMYDDDGNPKPYLSRESLYKRYQPMVQAISVENIETSLNALSTQMREDHELLVKLSETPDENGTQAKADINWLAAFSEYFMRYQNVINQYDEARRKQAIHNAQEAHARKAMESPEAAWQRTQAEIAQRIVLELYKTAKNSAYSDEAGRFSVNGHGKLIVRGMMDGESVFFVHEGPGGDYLEITELQHRIVEPE